MATGGGVVTTSATLDAPVLTGTVLTGAVLTDAVLTGAVATSTTCIGIVFTGAVLDILAFAGAFRGRTVLAAGSLEGATLAGLSLTGVVPTSIDLANGILSAVVDKQPVSMLQFIFRHWAHFTIFNHNTLLQILRQEEAGVRRQPIGFLYAHVQLPHQRGL